MKRLSLAFLAFAFVSCGGDSTAPGATGLLILTAPSATAVATKPLVDQPILQVLGSGGSAIAMAGVTVTATVSAGTGYVLTGATATTDATGAAAFTNLTLGSLGEGGPVTVRFSVPGGATPVTADIALSCEVKTLTLGVAFDDALIDGDCIRQSGSTGDSRFHLYDLVVPAGTAAIRVTDSSTAFPAVALVRGPNEPVRFFGQGAVGASTGVNFKVLVPSGLFRILATAGAEFTNGPFKLQVSATPEVDASCDPPQFASPLNTTQTLLAQCTEVNTGDILKFFSFLLGPGSSISATVTSSAFIPFIQIQSRTPDIVHVFATAQTTTVTVNHTNSTTGSVFYDIVVSSSDGAGLGDFSLQATISQPAPVVAGTIGLPASAAARSSEDRTRVLKGSPSLLVLRYR